MFAALMLPNPVAAYPVPFKFRSRSLLRIDVGAACVPLAFFPLRAGPKLVAVYVVILTFVVPLPDMALLTSRFELGDGAVVPMPTLTGDTKNFDVLPIMKLIEPLKKPEPWAMLLMRYSWVPLLNP